jgi:hypothetical protein
METDPVSGYTGAAVDAHYRAASQDQSLREHAVATSEVEHPLSRLGIEKRHDFHAEV